MTLTGNNAYGTFSFVVNPPAGVTGIGLWVDSENGQAQVSPTRMVLVNIVPTNCQPGSAGCPNVSGQSIWQVIGPYLLAAAIILTTVLAVLLLPLPVTVRYVVPIAVVAMLAILLALGFIQTLFLPHGALNAE